MRVIYEALAANNGALLVHPDGHCAYCDAYLASNQAHGADCIVSLARQATSAEASQHGYLFHCRFILEDGRHFFLDAFLPVRPVEMQDATICFCQSVEGARLQDVGIPLGEFDEQRGTGTLPEWLTPDRFFAFIGPPSPAVGKVYAPSGVSVSIIKSE